MSNPSIFNTNSQPNLAAPMPQINFAQGLSALTGQPATKQQASTGTQATAPAAPAGGQVNTTAAKNLGAAIGDWMNKWRQQYQAAGGQGQQQPGQAQAAPQQPGPPMNIVPQGYGYQ